MINGDINFYNLNSIRLSWNYLVLVFIDLVTSYCGPLSTSPSAKHLFLSCASPQLLVVFEAILLAAS